MANTSALLGSLLMCNADINYLVSQQIHWSNKYDANQAKLSKYTKYEEAWEKEYDKAMDETRTSELKWGNETIAEKTAGTETQAISYANYKVAERDENIYLELSDLDIEYDSMKTMYETLLETKRAEQESLKTAVSNAAADNGRTSGG